MIYIIIPTFNEAKEIKNTLLTIDRTLHKKIYEHQFVIVDDGSTDTTVNILSALEKKLPLVCLRHKVNKGPGEAFRTGLTEVCRISKGNDYIITIEADNTNDARSLKPMLKKLKNFDVVCASRYTKSGGYRDFPIKRYIFSIGANFLLRALFPIKGISDYTIFFRGYKIKAIRDGFRAYKEKFIQFSGFVGNAEILVHLRNLNLKMSEVPTTFYYKNRRSKSRMKIVKNLIEYYLFLKANL